MKLVAIIKTIDEDGGIQEPPETQCHRGEHIPASDWKKHFSGEDEYRIWQEGLREITQHRKTTSACIGDYSLINVPIDTSWMMPPPWRELIKSQAVALWKGGERNDDT